MNVFLKCAIFNAWGQKCAAPIELPDVGLGVVLKGMSLGLDKGVNAVFFVVSCWQSVKIRECLLKMHGCQYIGGGSVPPALSCQTLGRVTHRKAHRLALAEA